MPSVLQWLSAKLNCSSQVASLLAATASGDVDLVRGIIKANPDLGLYNSQGGQAGGRSALTVAAERGDLEILQIIYEGAVRGRGEAFAKQFLNAGAERGQTPLMRACIFGTPQHVECVAYLLRVGADPFAETDKGETCLHLAAKNAYTDCLSEILSASVSLGGAARVRLADALLPYTPPVRFVDMRNAAGFTPLHLTALKNSPAAMAVLLGAGAALDAGISDAGNTPHLARGSTALHIAAARGSQPCCSVLLDFQATVPGMELRGIRNARGLKASQLARLAGHDSLAALLSERGGAARSRARASRRRRRNREALASPGARGPASPEAVLALLVQRARLLLALREVGLALDPRLLQCAGEPEKVAQPSQLTEDAPKDDVAAAVAEFTELWRNGELDVASRAGGLLASLMPGDAPDEFAADSEAGEDSLAAAAMVQAALNAMTFFSPVAKPLDLPPTELKPTAPVAAAMVLQAAVRKLAGKGSGGGGGASVAMLLQAIGQAQSRADEGKAAAPATPVQQAESSSQAGTPRGAARPSALHTAPAGPGGRRSGEQVARILSKARRRQRRNALQSIEAAAAEASSHSPSPAADALARSAGDSPESSTRGNPLLDNPLLGNPLFPTAAGDGAGLAPGEARRAALRQAAMQTAPLPGALLTQAGGGANANPMLQPDSPRPAPAGAAELPTPFANSGGEDEPPQPPPTLFPWELYVREQAAAQPAAAPPASPPAFSGAMPQRRPGPARAVRMAASTPPLTPTAAAARGDAPASDGAQSGSRRVGSQEVPRSQASLTESLLSQSSRRLRGCEASDAPSGRSSMLTPGASRLLPTDTDSLDGTGSFTPQVSGALGTDESGSDSGADSDSSLDGGGKGLKARHRAMSGFDRCPICMDRPLQVGISTCAHKVCYGCAYQLCSRGLSPPTCPFCRGAIATFLPKDAAPTAADKPAKQASL